MTAKGTKAFALALSALGALGGSGCSGADDPAPVHRSAVERGAALFRDPRLSANTTNAFSCDSCHATTAADARKLPGAPLAGVTARPTFWGGAERDLLASVDACLRYFMLDATGLPRGDARTDALYAYLASLPAVATGPQPFTVVYEVKDLPPGDAGRGANVYAGTCSRCHGAVSTGAGRIAPSSILPDDTISEHGAYGPVELRRTFVEKVRHGGFLGYGGQMPPFSREALSDAELSDLLSFFKTY